MLGIRFRFISLSSRVRGNTVCVVKEHFTRRLLFTRLTSHSPHFTQTRGPNSISPNLQTLLNGLPFSFAMSEESRKRSQGSLNRETRARDRKAKRIALKQQLSLAEHRYLLHLGSQAFRQDVPTFSKGLEGMHTSKHGSSVKPHTHGPC